MQDENFSVIYSGNIVQVDFIKSVLEGSGIQCVLQDEYLGRMRPYAVPGGIKVDRRDADQSTILSFRALLTNKPDGSTINLIKSEAELEGLKRSGRVVRIALDTMAAAVQRGISTGELNEIGARTLAAHGAEPSPPKVYGFPASEKLRQTWAALAPSQHKTPLD